MDAQYNISTQYLAATLDFSTWYGPVTAVQILVLTAGELNDGRLTTL